jgi:type I restriction enzyme S subunit
VKASAKWPSVPLPEAFWFQEGPGVRKWQFKTSGIKLINVANIEKEGTLNLEKTERHLDEDEVAKKYSHFLVDDGDLVIASSGISFDEDGLLRTRGAFVRGEHLPLCLNTSTIRFKPIDGVSDLRFLRLWVNGREFRSQITKLVTGTAQQNFGPSHLKATKITLPPLAEQRRIAEVLDRAEALRAKRRAALAQLDALTQSLFLELFGDPATNPRGWPDSQLGKLCEKVIDCPHATPVYATSRTQYPCVRSSDIQNGDLTFADTKYVEKSEYEKRIARGKPQVGDVIYCREGARFGNAALITKDITLCLGQRIMLFRPHPKSAVGEYLWTFLSSPAAYRQATSLVGGSASPHVNIRDIISFQLPLPPIALQREFARRVTAVEKLKTAQRASLAELDALFATRQHRAFLGEL